MAAPHQSVYANLTNRAKEQMELAATLLADNPRGENQRAISGAIRRILCIEAARILPSVSFAIVQDATIARDVSSSALQQQASLSSDTSYPFLVALRSEVLRSVPRSDLRSRLTTVVRINPIPSLLLSYQLYGSVDLESDIIGRNKGVIRHPGVVSGTILVLSNDR